MNQQNEAVESKKISLAVLLQSFLILVLAAAAGAFAATLILQNTLPGMMASLQGSAPKAFWFISRSAAIVAYALLWLTVSLGLLMSNRLARVWPGGPAAYELHQFTSLLGMGLAIFHGLVLTGDQFIKLSVARVLVPFSSADYRPLAVGFGQIAFYLMVIIALSFYLRRRLSKHGWRLFHYLGFVTYLMALGHAIFSGTDSGAGWTTAIYFSTGSVVLFLFIFRVLTAIFRPRFKTAPAREQQTV